MSENFWPLAQDQLSELHKQDAEIARLKAELAEAQLDGRNARGLRLLLKPGEWKRRMESEPDADTRDLGQDVAMLVLLMRKQWRDLVEEKLRVQVLGNRNQANETAVEMLKDELAELRRKVGDWADAYLAIDYSGTIEKMREEAGKKELSELKRNSRLIAESVASSFKELMTSNKDLKDAMARELAVKRELSSALRQLNEVASDLNFWYGIAFYAKQNVSAYINKDRARANELAELRRKVGEWADEVDALDDCMADGIVSEMREEAGR